MQSSWVSLLTVAVLHLLSPKDLEHRAQIIETVEWIEILSPEFGYDPYIIAAMAIRESGFRFDLVSTNGSCGALQVAGRFLRPPMSCTELQSPEGSVRGALRVLEQFRAHYEAKGVEVTKRFLRACYASGDVCAAGQSERNLRGIHAQVQGAAVANTLLRGARWRIFSIKAQEGEFQLEGEKDDLLEYSGSVLSAR